MADIDEVDERIHFQKIVNAFLGYKFTMASKVKKKLEFIKSMNKDHQNYLGEYHKQLNEQLVCIDHNAEIIKLIIKDVENMFENAQRDTEKNNIEPVNAPDLDKIQSTFRQLVRDWSENGKAERELCYSPILNIIKELFPRKKNSDDIQILVPGAGLGRLAYEIAKLGYSCQGNEFSLFMLFTSNFILNRCCGTNSLRIYPWIHSGSNIIHTKDLVTPVLIPDTDPSTIQGKSQFTMAAGDFLDIYTEEDTWDCVATCFFIDCANNIIEFIETIHKILKPGGYWVNLGPLLYHFADRPGHKSIEPSWDVVKHIIKSVGFSFVKEPTFHKTVYTQIPHSMMQNEFKSVLFAVQKHKDNSK